MSDKSNDIVITAALRTPIGTYNGSLKNLSADKLGTVAIKEVIHKSKLKPEDIDEVIIGQVLTSASGQNPARQASINAGIPVSKPAHIINQVCGSGLRSVASAYQSIQLGQNKIIVAGGQENMSKSPHAIFYREDKKLSEDRLIDTMLHDGLIDSFNKYHMGVTAENVANKYKISRDDQDVFALKSQIKTQKAISKNKFQEEIIKLKIKKNENFSFEFLSIDGIIYDVEESIDLKTWNKIDTLDGTGSEITYNYFFLISEFLDTKEEGVDLKSFYRVKGKIK